MSYSIDQSRQVSFAEMKHALRGEQFIGILDNDEDGDPEDGPILNNALL